MAEIEVRTDGSTVRVSVGDRVIVRLQENPTTGYLWSIAGAGDPVDSERDYLVPGGPSPGAAGEHVFVLRAVKAGKAEVAFVLRRPWERDAASGRFSVHVLIGQEAGQ